MRNRTTIAHQRSRRGRKASKKSAFLLVLVLIVIAMAGLAALNFSNTMLTSHEVSSFTGMQLQARMCAESGLQSVRLYLANDRLTRASMGGQWDNAGLFQAMNVVPDQDPKRRGNFTVISTSLDQDGYFNGLRYGLQDESAKINLNTLAQLDQLASAGALASAAMGEGMASMGVGQGGGQTGGGQAGGGGASGGSTQLASQLGQATQANLAQSLLMALPGMTEDVADSILDWLDADEDARPLGAEFGDYYSQLQPPYKPANGQLQSVEQLLLVRGVTAVMLFGYDENRNGVLDSDEQSKMNMGLQPGMPPGTVVAVDPNVAPPPPLGWAAYFTLHSQEKNVANDGTQRINVNGADLQTLYNDMIAAGVSDRHASFIVAYRLAGQPSPTAGNPMLLLMQATSGAAAGGTPPSPPPPPSGITAPLTNMLVALQQRGGRGGQGGANFGPQGGGQGGRGGQGQGGGANFGPGGGRGNGGGGPGMGGGPGGGGPGGRGQGGPEGGPGGPGGPGQGGPQRRGGGGGGDDQRGPGEGGRGERGRGQGGGGMGQLQAAGGNGGGGGQGGQQEPPQPWSSAALSSFDLSQQGGVQLNQLLDLVDATVVVNQNGTQTTYTSPFTSSPLDVANYSPIIMDKLTTVDSQTIPGRINIMECPREILLGLPGMTQEIGEGILQARIDGSQSETRRYETWLACEGYVTMDQMRALTPLINCGGDVFRAQVVGYIEGSAASSRFDAIVSGAGQVPEVLFFRRLDHLGRGFDIATLGQRYDAALGAGLGIQ